MITGTDPTLLAFLALTIVQLVLLNLAVLLAQRGRRKRPVPRFVVPMTKGQE